jgi:hypothetical protein
MIAGFEGRLAVIFLLSIISITGFTQIDCKKFRTGDFYYPSAPGAGYSQRTKGHQLTHMTDGSLVKWKLTWTSDCSYEMVVVKLKRNKSHFRKGDRIVATIVSTDGDCYRFKCTFYNQQHPDGKDIPESEMCMKIK